MNTINKLVLIITASLAGIILTASCSKEPKGKKGGEEKATVTNVSDTFSRDKNSLNAVRNGQYVNLNWQTGATSGKIKQINIMRSSTGVNQQKKVATLEPNVATYQDCLPDENAYWYWVQVFMAGGKVQKIGPVRVDMDRAGSANYIKTEDSYKISITRTDDFATLNWDFPDGNYKEIKILRYPHSVAALYRGQTQAKGKDSGHIVTVALEKKSQCTDALPDANSDYWYWFRITLKSGAVIDRGPIKADYVSQ